MQLSQVMSHLLRIHVTYERFTSYDTHAHAQPTLEVNMESWRAALLSVQSERPLRESPRNYDDDIDESRGSKRGGAKKGERGGGKGVKGGGRRGSKIVNRAVAEAEDKDDGKGGRGAGESGLSVKGIRYARTHTHAYLHTRTRLRIDMMPFFCTWKVVYVY